MEDVTNCQPLLNMLAALNYYTKLCQKEGNQGPLKLNSKIPNEIRIDKISSGKSGYQALQTCSAKRLNLPTKAWFLTKIMVLISVLGKTSMLPFPFNLFM